VVPRAPLIAPSIGSSAGEPASEDASADGEEDDDEFSEEGEDDEDLRDDEKEAEQAERKGESDLLLDETDEYKQARVAALDALKGATAAPAPSDVVEAMEDSSSSRSELDLDEDDDVDDENPFLQALKVKIPFDASQTPAPEVAGFVTKYEEKKAAFIASHGDAIDPALPLRASEDHELDSEEEGRHLLNLNLSADAPPIKSFVFKRKE